MTTADGDRAVLGVVDEDLVVARDADHAAEIASRRTAAVPGAEGSIVATADAERVANEAIRRFQGGTAGLAGSLFTGPLGALTGSLETDTRGMRGKLRLEVE